jgi:hypothetical protein
VFTNFSTEIEWYPGKCLTQKVLKKKPRKGSKNTKPITKTEDCESFFNFFSPPQVPDDDEEIDEDIVSLSYMYLLLWLNMHTRTSLNLIWFSLFNRLNSCRTKWNKIMTLGMLLRVMYYSGCRLVTDYVFVIRGFDQSVDAPRSRVCLLLLNYPFCICQIYHQRQDYPTCCLVVHWRGCSR